MRLLLDTHVWLWALSEPDRLDRRAADDIRDSGNDVFLSAASAWELAIKISTGKLRLEDPLEVLLARSVARDRISELPVTYRHATALGALPALHRDPFDRLLVAQSRSDRLTLLTVDDAVLQYGGSIRDARPR